MKNLYNYFRLYILYFSYYISYFLVIINMSILHLDINIIELIFNKLSIKDKIKFNYALNKEQKIKYNKDKINKLRIINFINENNLTIHIDNLSFNFIRFLNENYLEPDVIKFSILYNFKSLEI